MWSVLSIIVAVLELQQARKLYIVYVLTKLLSQAENIIFPNRTEAEGVSVEMASSSIFQRLIL